MNRLLHVCLFLSVFNVAGKAEIPITPASILADTIDPLIFCPGSQIINLAPLDCDTVVTYVVNAFDDQGQVIVIQLDGLPSGANFPSGATVNTFLATDLSGNTATCSFTITTFEPMTQPFCADLTTVKLDQNCSKTVKAFDVLEGGPYGCALSYTIEVDKTTPFGNGPWLNAVFNGADINQEYQVRVTSLLTGQRCYGNIQVRDSLPPVVMCQNINVPCALPLEHLTPAFLRDSFGVSIAVPTVNDACSGNMLSISFVDVLQNLPCDENTTVSGIIRRIWSATDANGNTGTCEQIISRQRILANVQIPAAKTTSCDNLDLSEATNGLPYIQFSSRRYPLTPASYCEFDLEHFDTIQPGACGGSYTVERTWKIYDACLPLSGTNPKIGVQNISVVDNKGPAVQCPADMIVTVTDNNCRASVNLPDVFLHDGCSALASIQAFWTDSSISKNLFGSFEYTGGDTIGVLGTVANFPVGTTSILYVTIDSCGNNTDCTFNLTVANMVAPLAKCDTFLVVGLPASGFLSVPAMVLDNGSSDDCSPVNFKAKLSTTNSCSQETMFSDTLHICCHNLGDTLKGTLRVYDVTTPAGVVAGNFGAGHFTDCAFKIKVSGSNAPTCTAPANITVSCEAFDPTLESYGGIVSQSCSVDTSTLTVSLTNFDTLCSRGTISRIFRVFSANGQMGQCSQKIVVTYEQDYFVRFPDDVILTMCDTTGIYGVPTYFGNQCEMMQATFTDETFTVVPDACIKIERTWKIVNLCTYDPALPIVTIPNPNPNPVTNHVDNLPGPVVSNISAAGNPWKSSVVKINPTDGAPTNYSIFFDPNANGYTYKQIIKLIDTQKPVIENCLNSDTLKIQDQTQNDPQLWNAGYWFDPLLVSFDLCEAPSEIGITGYDACAGSNVNFRYQLFLDLNSDNARETLIDSDALPPVNTVNFNNVSGQPEARQFDFRPVANDQKYRFALEQAVVNGKKTAYVRFNTAATPGTYTPPQLPFGHHKIKWTITDGCGNSTTCEYPILIRDGKAPQVFCAPSLSASILPSKDINITATDVLQFSTDNCTPSQYLAYGIRKAGTGNGFPTNPNGSPISFVTFGCDELGAQMVELWSRDKMYNAGSCLATVNIQDPSNNCVSIPDPVVKGYIRTVLNEDLEGVRIEIPQQFMLPIVAVTDSFGYYEFPGSLPYSSTDKLIPEYDVDPLNGLTTFDLVLISKHILGIEALGSPYKMIAADANKSNSITTFDIVEFRKLIQGIFQFFPNNNSWRFVPKSYIFPNPLFPFAPQFPENIPLSNISPTGFDGDFVGIKIGDVNYSATISATAPADERNAGTMHFSVSTTAPENIQAGEIFDVTLTAEKPMLGCQFTLDYHGIEVLDCVPGADVERDHLAMLPAQKAITMAWEKGGMASFTLKCRAEQAGNIREMLSLSSRITKAEAYQENAGHSVERYNLALQFPSLSTFELFQNQPNPFAKSTDITFNLPEASEATLRVFDASGRSLYVQSSQYTRGTHTISLDKSALNATGMLYYKLETATHQATRKMVVFE